MTLRTEVLGPATYLMCCGYAFRDVVPNPDRPSAFFFEFDDPDNTGAAKIREYYAGGKVTAMSYDACLRQLKIQLTTRSNEMKRRAAGGDVVTPNYFSKDVRR